MKNENNLSEMFAGAVGCSKRRTEVPGHVL